MKREYLVFLVGGFAFGILFGYALFNAFSERPAAAIASGATPASPVAGPMGPGAPTQVSGGAPMVEQVNDLKRRIQADPQDTESLLKLGDLYRLGGMWDQADPVFDRAIETRPDDPDLIRGLANLYHDSERWERAIALYRRVLVSTPEDPDVLTDMGICHKALGDFDEALALFAKASALDPNHWQSLFNTVVVEAFDLGRLEQATATLRTLDRVKPGSPEVDRLRQAVEQRSATSAGS